MALPLIDPVALRLFGLEIRWYGIAWAIGFLIVYFFLKNYRKLAKIKDSDEVVLVLTLFALIFSKLFAVIYHPDYLKNIFTLSFLRSGFASIGAFFGILIGIWCLKRKRKADPYMLFIIALIPLVLAQAIGRLGNYANQEFYGLPCDCFWCVKLDTCRHPAQLYEAFLEVLLFIVFYTIFKREFVKHSKKRVSKEKKVRMISVMIISYSLIRFFVEFFKDMSKVFGLNLTQWQLIGIVLVYILIVKPKMK